MDRSSLLVSPDWLQARLGSAGLSIVDASWYLPAHARDAREEYIARHVPHAVFFDLDAVSDTTNPLPHMLPSASDFGMAAGALGIGTQDTIIVYDGMGLFSAPRIWWTFKVFGAADVRILDGGLLAWIAAGYEVESGPMPPRKTLFEARKHEDLVADMAFVSGALREGRQVLDARPAGRFSGADPEFRPGLPSGHMPGASNLPQSTLVKDGRLLDDDALRHAFEAAGIDLDHPVITTCGSGVSAATLTFALAVLGKPLGRLYDGSWTEWAGAPQNPIEPRRS